MLVLTKPHQSWLYFSISRLKLKPCPRVSLVTNHVPRVSLVTNHVLGLAWLPTVCLGLEVQICGMFCLPTDSGCQSIEATLDWVYISR